MAITKWRQKDECVHCGERKAVHSRAGLCRYAEPGWSPVTKVGLPADRKRVLARRGKEVFVALVKPDYDYVTNKFRPQWFTPFVHDDRECYGLVDGVTDWRELRKRDGLAEKQARLTSSR